MKNLKIVIAILLMLSIGGCTTEPPTTPTIKDDETVVALKNIGYQEDDINLIVNRLSNEEISVLKTTDLVNDIGSYLNLDYFNFSYLERYQAYKEKSKKDYETVVTYVNIGIDKDFYDKTLIKKIVDPDDVTVLVNKYNQLPSDYIPKLETISTVCGSGQLKNIARVAFEKMCTDARSIGYTLRSVSAYRSYDYQEKLYNYYVNIDGVQITDTYSARAGHSEHQTGLALDVAGSNNDYIKFENSKEFPWLKENAHLYGFVIHYQKNKENVTGYKYEPWHIRYVGVDIATDMYKKNLTYDEYYVRYLSK